uniref:Phospholipid-transporting ATPase n=1 Tax=Macrostomum lignano TaxID=282301 RepID=A0A1I8HXH3_9PLAT
MMNNRGPRFKRSKLERQINKDVIWCVIILFVLCLFGAIGSGIWLHGFVKPESVIFLSLGNDTRSTPVVQAFINFWTYIIILQAMIPLALYVTVEFVKLGQTVYINSDLDMYDPERDMPAECRALNITEDLGQIEYVFTDKTGTLTENKMEFKRCSVLGHDYEYCQTPPRPTADSQASIECRQPILDGGNQKRDCDFDPEPQCADETCQSPPPPPPTTLTRSPTSELADALAAPDGPSLRRVTSLRQRRLLDFFLVMAVCNSVVVSIDQPASESAADSTATSATSVDSAVKRWKRQVWRRKAPPAASSELSASAAVAASAAPTPSLTPSPTPPTPLVLETDQLSAGTPEPCRYTDAELTKAYVAESPDEAALVRAACRSGCKLVQRDADSCLVWLPADGHVRLPLLCVMPFDADRKRMSVLVRDPATNRPMLLTKGADCAVLDRLRPSDPADTDSDADRVLLLTRLHMEQYSVAGLRTLCLAVRYLDEAEYADWLAEYTLAQRRIQGREAAMARAFDRLEAGLELLGATGVEDRLQEGAADTVAALREAGISVWVLTGDKQETAVQVGHACRLLTEGQQLLTLVADSPAEAGDRVRRWLRELDVAYRPAYQIRQRRARPAVRDGVALVLDGRALRHCLDELVSCDFLLLAEQCSSVLCCRTTPSQKAAVVGLVKESLGMQTLAIGDGANDVSMIQTADIGVGISGQEGMQAVMAADFSLARFRFLKKLLLVHGHWCYDRLARMSLYLFYKNCVYIMMLFWYQLFNGFSGQVNIGQVYQICFNLTMTSLGPLVIGILDRHLSAEILMANPVLYTDAQNCRSYLPWHFWLNILDAVWQSLVVFFVAYLGAMDTDCGIWSFGDTVVSAGVITAVAHNALEVRGWTGLHWFALLGELGFAWRS